MANPTHPEPAQPAQPVRFIASRGYVPSATGGLATGMGMAGFTGPALTERQQQRRTRTRDRAPILPGARTTFGDIPARDPALDDARCAPTILQQTHPGRSWWWPPAPGERLSRRSPDSDSLGKTMLSLSQALQICQTCPAPTRAACAALATRDTSGIYGGVPIGVREQSRDMRQLQREQQRDAQREQPSGGLKSPPTCEQDHDHGHGHGHLPAEEVDDADSVADNVAAIKAVEVALTSHLRHAKPVVKVPDTGLDRTRHIPVGARVHYGDHTATVTGLDHDPGYVFVKLDDGDGVARTRAKSRLLTEDEWAERATRAAQERS